jgi:hypothetical protein
MRLILKILAIALILVGLLTCGSYLITGRLPWHGLTFIPGTDLKLPAELNLPTLKGGRQLVYKWRDANGVWHFGTEPPGGNLSYEQIEVDPNWNIIDAVPDDSK